MCDNNTVLECLNHLMFGDFANHPVAAGSVLFLHNTDTKELHGVFECVEAGQSLDKQLWNGRFQHQARVKRMKQAGFGTVHDDDFARLLPGNGKGHQFEKLLNGNEVGKLIKLFSK